MKTMMFAVAAMFVCGVVLGAEEPQTKEEPNVHYEKLKFLEPLVGEWRLEWTNERGRKGERYTTRSWSESKRMLLVETKRRRAEKDEDITKQEWTILAQNYFYWNDAEERVEYVQVLPHWGNCVLHEVQLRGKNVLDCRVLSKSVKWEGKLDLVMGKDSYTVKVKRKNVDGQPLDDVEFTMMRVE